MCWPPNSNLFFKRPLVDNEFDMSDLQRPFYLTSGMYVAASTECNVTKYYQL